MKSRQQILRAYYIGVMKKAATWLGLSSLVISMFAPAATLAAQPGVQMGTRSLVLGSSAASASTSYSLSFKPGSASTLVKAIKIELCTSPLELVACSQPNSATFAGATLGSVGGELTATWVPAISTNTYTLTKAAGNTLTSAGATETIVVNSVTNPNTTTTFYARITTYSSDTVLSTANEFDFGAVAVATASQITASANVQESLVFCIGTTGGSTGCSGGTPVAGPNTVSLGTGANNVLSSSTPSGGQSVMYADTNATTGYVISYQAANLASTNDTITAAGAGAGTGSAFVAGSPLFGINIASTNTYTGTTSGGITGTGSGQAVNANYTTNDRVAFVPTTTTTLANSNSLPTTGNLYKISYIAQAGSTTKPGAFSTVFTFVATGTF